MMTNRDLPCKGLMESLVEKLEHHSEALPDEAEK